MLYSALFTCKRPVPPDESVLYPIHSTSCVVDKVVPRVGSTLPHRVTFPSATAGNHERALSTMGFTYSSEIEGMYCIGVQTGFQPFPFRPDPYDLHVLLEPPGRRSSLTGGIKRRSITEPPLFLHIASQLL